MSSFCCPHFDEPEEWCRRVRQYCVPGRPGCVLRGTSSFVAPVEERIRAKEEEMAARAAAAPHKPADLRGR